MLVDIIVAAVGTLSSLPAEFAVLNHSAPSHSPVHPSTRTPSQPASYPLFEPNPHSHHPHSRHPHSRHPHSPTKRGMKESYTLEGSVKGDPVSRSTASPGRREKEAPAAPAGAAAAAAQNAGQELPKVQDPPVEVCGAVQSLKVWIGAHSSKTWWTRTQPTQSTDSLGVDSPFTDGNAAGLCDYSSSSTHDPFAGTGSYAHQSLLPLEVVSRIPPGIQLTMDHVSWTDCMDGGNRSVQAVGRQVLCRVEGSLQGVPVTLLRLAARESGCQLAIMEGKRETVSLRSTMAVDFWNLTKVRERGRREERVVGTFLVDSLHIDVQCWPVRSSTATRRFWIDRYLVSNHYKAALCLTRQHAVDLASQFLYQPVE